MRAMPAYSGIPPRKLKKTLLVLDPPLTKLSGSEHELATVIEPD